MDKRRMENLKRGLVGMLTPSGVYLSWRFLDSDPNDVSFIIYRSGEKIASIKNSSNFLDENGKSDNTYEIASVINGKESEREGTFLPLFAQNGDANGNFIEYELCRPSPKPAIKFRNPRKDLFEATGKYFYMPVPLAKMNEMQACVKDFKAGKITKEDYDKKVREFKKFLDSLGLDEKSQGKKSLRELGYDESGRVPFMRDENGALMYDMGEYSPNDMTVGDLDGDGEYELVVKWEPSNSSDPMFSCRTTSPCIIDAYDITKDGIRLMWRIDMGFNIRASAHETQLLLYDFDGDGKAELVLRTADGTTSGTVENGEYVPKWFVGDKNASNIEKWIKEGKAELVEKYTPKILNGFSVCWEDPLYCGPDGEAGVDSFITSGKYSGNPLDQTWCKVYRFGLCCGAGDEYITAFDGETGKILDSVPYPFAIRDEMWGINPTCRRGAPCTGMIKELDALKSAKDPSYVAQSFWTDPENEIGSNYIMFGDSTGNRASRFLGAVAFLDGKNPCAVICRGYYARTTLAAYRLDVNGKKLILDSTFDSSEYKNHSDYECRGNHNLAVGDADGDGRDEIHYGSIAFWKEHPDDKKIRCKYIVGMALPAGDPPQKNIPLDPKAGINPDGSIKDGYKFTYFWHGDAIHLLPKDKSNSLVLFTPHEDNGDSERGWAPSMHAHDAATGEVLAASFRFGDQGRAVAGNVNPLAPDRIVYTGNISIDSKTGEQVQIGAGVNGLIYWTGSLVRQIINGGISQINARGEVESVMEFDGCSTINGTKKNPCLQADLFGDWREEVIMKSSDSTIRIYTTNMPADYKIRTLMHDAHYRLGVANENICYNQPPHTGFFMGYEQSDGEITAIPGTSKSGAKSIIPPGKAIF